MPKEQPERGQKAYLRGKTISEGNFERRPKG